MAASSRIIHHDYYSDLKFESGPFPSEKDENYISTNQHIPSSEEKKELGRECHEEEHGYFNTNEAVLKKADPGIDGRHPVGATETFPHSIHAKIEMRFTDGKYGGSGSLIGPRHVLTCGHNVYDNKTGWAKSIKVYPGRHGTYAPFGETNVARVYIFKKWEETQEKTYDIALLVLDGPVGTSSGWGGIKCALINKSPLFDEKNRFSVTGYPGDKGFNYMHTMEYQLDHYTPQILRYLHDTNKGQSGSAIWRKENDQIQIIGVHTSGPAEGEETNSGVRLTQEIAEELLIKKVEETYTLASSLQNSPSKKEEETQDLDSKPCSEHAFNLHQEANKAFKDDAQFKSVTFKGPKTVDSKLLQEVAEASLKTATPMYKQAEQDKGKTKSETNIKTEENITFEKKFTATGDVTFE